MQGGANQSPLLPLPAMAGAGFGAATGEEAAAEVGALELLVSPATFFFEPLLKSVSYQPPPFNLKPAAEIFFISSGLLQAGQ
jgi:hypothetical protein